MQFFGKRTAPTPEQPVTSGDNKMKTTTDPKSEKAPIDDLEGSLSNLLMISNRRHRNFYERAARELLASGKETIQLSALGDAVPLAIQLANTLQDKKAATLTKIETKLVEFPFDEEPSNRRNNGVATRASGVSIIMTKHPEFKGTRIIPAFVFFCETETAFPTTPDRIIASVNPSTNDEVFNAKNSTGKLFLDVLGAAGHDVKLFKDTQASLHTDAVKNNIGSDDKSIKFVGDLKDIQGKNPGLRGAFCRLCPKLKDQPSLNGAGTVFIYVFADGKHPHGHENNAAVVNVLAPKGSDFPEKDAFLGAVTLASCNLMNAVCDFNGFSKRSDAVPALRRLAVLRVPLFSCDDQTRHPKASVDEVALAILKGLDEGFHFGPAPRLNFVNTKDIFKKVWMQQGGQPEESIQFADGEFRRAKDE